MNISESVKLAFEAVKNNKLRTSLTLLSIAIGVFAIIGASSLVSSIENAVTNQMSSMGDNTIYLKKYPSIMTGNVYHKYRKRKPITYTQYKDFKKQMTVSQIICCNTETDGQTVKYHDNTTNNDVSLIGCDDGFFTIQNVSIGEGRAFLPVDIAYKRNVAIIGNDIVVKVFPNINPIGKTITIDKQRFEVIGVTAVKGAVMGQSQDNNVYIPISPYLDHFASYFDETLEVVVKAESKDLIDATMDEATGIMRSIRGVKPWEANNFEIETNETISKQFANFTDYLSWFGIISGIMALIAAGVGIMNIMLVSVKERTREIGIRKAIGAKKSWILMQFIIEAITLCLIGGVIGIILGFIGSGLISKLMNISMVFPIVTVLVSILLCTIFGVVFGAYPAYKAAKLDPIDALRYE